MKGGGDGAEQTFASVIFDPDDHVRAINEKGLSLSGLTEPECFTTPARAISLTAVQSLAREQPIDIAFI